MLRQGVLLVWVLSIFVSPAGWAREEIVLTVPVETSVHVPGIRDTSKVWLELINEAKQRIHLEHFYLSDEPGEALEPILEALRKAAARGVEVRLILEKKFFITYPEPATSLGKLPGFSLKIIDFEKISGGIQHAKFMIVDGKKYYVGSANMDWRALKHIHEVGVAGDDASVAKKLDEIFSFDWGGIRPLDEVTPSESFIKVVGSPEKHLPKNIGYSLAELLTLLRGAEKEMQLALYELSTKVFGDSSAQWPTLFDAIAAAAARGIKVEILIDASKIKPDHVALNGLKSSGNVTIKAVGFPPYSGGEIPFARLLHSKFLIVDGKTAWVGTDNWAKNYFTNSRGVGLILEDRALLQSLRSIFDKLWKSPYVSIF